MLEASAIPYLKRLSDEKIVSHTVCIFGMGESTVDSLFADEMNAMSNPSMAPYAKECDCLLKVTAKAHSEEEAESMLAPLLHELAEEYDGVYKVGKVNVDEQMELAMRYQVSSIPMLVVLKDGKPVSKAVGYRSKADLLDMLKNAI